MTAATQGERSDGVRRTYTFDTEAATIARAETEWVAPGTIPAEVVAAPPSWSGSPFVYTRRVQWQDVDETSTAAPATLSGYAEDCGIAICDAYGWPLERCTSAGFFMVLRRHQITYGEPARLGDILEIATWASDLKRASAIRHYEMTTSGRTVARFRSHYVWVDATTRRPTRIPGPFLADFRDNFVG